MQTTLKCYYSDNWEAGARTGGVAIVEKKLPSCAKDSLMMSGGGGGAVRVVLELADSDCSDNEEHWFQASLHVYEILDEIVNIAFEQAEKKLIPPPHNVNAEIARHTTMKRTKKCSSSSSDEDLAEEYSIKFLN